MGINSLLPRSISLRKKAGQAKEGKASDNGDSLPDAASSKPVQPYPVQPPPAAANADEPKKTAESPASSPDAKKPKESIAEKAIHKVDDKVHDVVNRVVPSSMVKAAGSAGSKANHAVDKVTHSKTSQKADKAGFAMVNMVGAAAKKGLNAAQHTGHEALKKVAGAAHDAQSMVGVAAVVSDADIGKPTPPHRWFQPAEGWPDVEWHSEWWQDVHSPPLLMPTAKEVPSLFATRIAPIGELRVEILEAEGLKAPSVAELVFDKIDPYAVFLFEGCAARTNVRRNTYHPRWHHMSARAFAFPIRFPYSCLYMALMDKDFNADDALGRIVIELGSLAPGTEYDAWFSLQSPSSWIPGSCGHVRLRFSVNYFSERKRLLRYVTPSSPPEFVIPFAERHLLRDSKFAYVGKSAPTSYSWSVFRAYLEEVDDILDTLLERSIGAFGNLLFWRGRAAFQSALVCIGWQLLVSYPRLFPAALPGVLMFFLSTSYSYRKSSTGQTVAPIERRPPPVQLLRGLVTGHPMAPLTVDPMTAAEIAAHQKVVARVEGNSFDAEGLLDLKFRARFAAPKDSLQEEIENVKEQINGEVKEMVDALDNGTLEEDTAKSTAHGAHGKEKPKRSMAMAPVTAVAGASKVVGNVGGAVADKLNPTGVDALAAVAKLNPMALLLGPVQVALGGMLVHLRALERTLGWHDLSTTLGLYLQLLVVSLALTLVPWGLVLRVGGFLALGPHMHLVGRMRDKKAAKQAEKECVYAAADRETKKRMVQMETADLYKEARKKIEKARKKLAQRSELQVERDEFVANAKYCLVMQPTRNTCNVKDPAHFDLQRSRAYPVPPPPDAAEQEAAAATKIAAIHRGKEARKGATASGKGS